MNNEIEEVPLSVRLLHQCLSCPPIPDLLQSFLTPSEILSLRLVHPHWSDCFTLPQFKIQPPLPSEPQDDDNNNDENELNQRGILIEKFNGNIYGSGSSSDAGFGIGDFVDQIPHRKCRISILINTFDFYPQLIQFIENNQPINRFITHLALRRCYAYEANPDPSPNQNQNSDRDLRIPLLSLDQFFTLIFEQLQHLEYLALDRIPRDWTSVRCCQLIQRTRERLELEPEILPNSRASLRTLLFAHGWLNMRDWPFLRSFLSLFPNLENIWGMSLKCGDAVRFSGKSRAMRSIILEGSTLTSKFTEAIQEFTKWVNNPSFEVELEEVKFNLNFYWKHHSQGHSGARSDICQELSAILDYHQDSLKTLLLQPLSFWFPALFHAFPVFSQVRSLKLNGKHIFTETWAETETAQVDEESYAFFPLNSEADVDFNLAHHFPNLNHVKISCYFPNHSRTTQTLLNYCFPPTRNLVHKGVQKLELVDLAGLMNSDVIQRFAFLFPSVTNLTLKKNVRDPHFQSALSAIWRFWPNLKELQCKLVYKTEDGMDFGLRNWDSAVTGISEEICDGLRRNPDQGYQQQVDLNSPSILNMRELRKFFLVFTTDSAAAKQEIQTAVNNPNWRGFLSCVSWDYGFNRLPRLEFVVIFGKFCQRFRDRRVLGPMLASTRTKIVDETPP